MIEYYTLNNQTISSHTGENTWRLIYSGSLIINYFQSSGRTQTSNTLEVFSTEEEVLEHIQFLNLSTGSLES